MTSDKVHQRGGTAAWICVGLGPPGFEGGRHMQCGVALGRGVILLSVPSGDIWQLHGLVLFDSPLPSSVPILLRACHGVVLFYSPLWVFWTMQRGTMSDNFTGRLILAVCWVLHYLAPFKFVVS
jgi:hypothetical protein